MKNCFLPVTMALLFLLSSSVAASMEWASSVKLVVGTIQGAAGSKVEVPIEAQSAQQLGALQLELVYDPDILEPLSVEPGTMSSDLTVDHHVATPGRLRIVMNSSARESVSGDGILIKAVFNVTGTDGQGCELALEEVQAWDNTRPDSPPYEMLVSVESGVFKVTSAIADSSDTADIADTNWVMILGIAGGVLLLLIIAFALANTTRKG